MYKIINSSKVLHKDDIVKIHNDNSKNIHEFKWCDDSYMLSLALAVLNYNDKDYVFTVSGIKCVLLSHNYSWGNEIQLFYQNYNGQERQSYIDCVNNVDSRVEIFKVKYDKTGKKTSVWIGTLRRINDEN